MTAMKMRVVLIASIVSVCSLLLGVLMVGSASALTTTAASQSPTGSLTVAEVGTEWPGLDPATGTEVSADYDYMDAIFGQLFEQGAKGKIIPDLATGYHFSKNGLKLTIGIRKGVTFQDGTPFNAQAVAFNLRRDFDPKNACACLADFASVKSVAASGNDVVLTLKSPDFPLMEAWVSGESPDWIASPTALAKEGVKEFDIKPVGAGPFQVVSNAPSSKLVLKAFPGYWRKGFPKLQDLTFLSVGSTQSAYAALQAGSVQLIATSLDVDTLGEAQKNSAVKIVTAPGIFSTWVQLDTLVPPFNNKLAREAMYYATDAPEYLKVIGKGQGVLTQSPSGPGGEFFKPKVPGYRTYNLAKARALVKQIGGLSFTYELTNSPTAVSAGEALQSMWEAAGIKVKLDPLTFTEVVGAFVHHTWQASAEVMGGVEPSQSLSGLASRVGSKGLLSGVKNPTLDKLIAEAIRTPTLKQRSAIYQRAFKIISDQAYGPFLYVASSNAVMAKSVTGVNPVAVGSFGPLIQWEGVGISST